MTQPNPAILCILLSVLAIAPAHAAGLISGSVTVESDDRVRGASFSDQRPDLHLNLAYDQEDGWYAGAGAAIGRFSGTDHYRATQVAAYTGYVHAGPLSWEGGVVATHLLNDAKADYAEAYAGVLGEQWNARLYLSPRYLDRPVRTAYLDLSASHSLSERWRLFGHLGALHRLSGEAEGRGQQTRFDGEFGLGFAHRDVDVQLAWVTSSVGGPFSVAGYQRRDTLMLSLTHFF